MRPDSPAVLNEYLDEEERRALPFLHAIFPFIKAAVCALIAALFISNFVLINAKIPSSSMEGTIMTGDRLIGNRLAYVLGKPHRGDVVIFYAPDQVKTLYIKRVIGMPGETVEIRDGRIFINGSALREPYIKEPMDPGEIGTYTVPDGSYFLLGDNRRHSNDGRYWHNHYVDAGKIIARAEIRYFPKISLIRGAGY